MIDMNERVQWNLPINPMKEKKYENYCFFFVAENVEVSRVHYNVIILRIQKIYESGELKSRKNIKQLMEIYFIMIIIIHFNPMLIHNENL